MEEIRKAIIAKTNYFKKCNEMDFGTHGPEIKNNEVYLSIYHFLEFLKEFPNRYNTVKLGGYLSDLVGDDKISCKYECQDFTILKFPVSLLLSEKENFRNYLR